MLVGLPMREKLAVACGHHGIDGFVDGLDNALGLVDDDEHVGGVEALELVHLVAGEAKGKAVMGQFQAGDQQLAAEGVSRGTVEAAYLLPEDVAHLSRRGRRGENGGRLVRAEEPEDGDGGSEALADAVASLDCHAAVVAEGVEDLFLFGPEVDTEDDVGEADRRAPECLLVDGLGQVSGLRFRGAFE